MRRLLALLALAGAAAPAAAQPDTLAVYFPLSVGNRWEFAVEAHQGTPAGYTRLTVAADTVVAGEPGVRVRIERFGVGGGPATSASDCAAIPAFGYDTAGTPVGGYSLATSGCEGMPGTVGAFNYTCYWRAGHGSGPVVIGGQTVTAPVTMGDFEFPGQGGLYARSNWMLGRGIGPIRYAHEMGTSGTGSGQTSTLIYARVDGVTYGSSVVATEPPAATAGLTAAVAPNPARGAAALDVALPAPAEVRVAVYDALGRRVLALDAGVFAVGAHRLPLDTGRLAPGVYVVRLTAGEGAATARLVVAR